MLEQEQSTPSPVTIDEAFKALKHWRENKGDYSSPGIPNEVWLQILQLEDNGYSASELKRIFNLSSTQYATKKNQLINTAPSSTAVAEQKSQSSNTQRSEGNMKFCEATVKQNIPSQNIPSLTEAASQNKKAVVQLKSTQNEPESFLDMTTIIVECIHPNGHRLNIHTTTQSIDKVMQGFFLYGVDVS